MKKDKTMSQFTFVLVKQLLRFLAFFFVGYRHKDKYKINKGESVLVLSNHQTDIDSLLINLSFNRLLCAVATDNLFKKGFFNWLLHKFGAIPKKKGSADLNSTLMILKAIRGKRSVVLFPEGNRSYAEFQYYISPDIARFIKSMKPTLVLFNLHGGTGTRPRFMRKRRLGKFYGSIKLVLKYEEYKDIPDDELYQLIIDNLRVIDSESGELYKSPIRGEYLERMFFVCPNCQKTQTLYSKKELITCTNCGFEAEFTEDLHLKTNNEAIDFTKLLDWYNYQIRWCKEFTNPDNKPIFVDQNVTMVTAEPNQKSTLVAKGEMVLYNDVLKIDDLSFELKNIEVSSPVSGIKLLFTFNEKSYEIKGGNRFNPLKYSFMFNKLDTKMKEKNNDSYFKLEEIK